VTSLSLAVCASTGGRKNRDDGAREILSIVKPPLSIAVYCQYAPSASTLGKAFFSLRRRARATDGNCNTKLELKCQSNLE
jgi:hypothetical protein